MNRKEFRLRERERDRERQRQADRQTDRDRETQKHRERQREWEQRMETEVEKKNDILRHKQPFEIRLGVFEVGHTITSKSQTQTNSLFCFVVYFTLPSVLLCHHPKTFSVSAFHNH